MRKFSWLTKACGVFLLWTTAAIALPAQTLTVLHSFDDTDGANPDAGLVQGTNGMFYGTTSEGGPENANCDQGSCGTVFSMTASGALTTLHNFDGIDGYGASGLIQGTNGMFYGTTSRGGVYDDGTVFSITANGTLTTLHSFDETDGRYPLAGLVEGTNGMFYGTTSEGGAYGYGTVFKITPSGTLTTLYSFCPEGLPCTDGALPVAGLALGTNGTFYGTTYSGGTSTGCFGGCGTVFKITTSGTLTTLHSFDGIDGNCPLGLVQGTNGMFYGTTSEGGVYGAYTDGTVFSITANGTLTTLHSFDGTDGANPDAGPVQATDGNLYGTTASGALYGYGTVFKITTRGTLTTLHQFQNSPDGAEPSAGLFQGTNGKLYGTTDIGGANGDGTVFSLSVGLGPFVITQTTSGAEGAAVTILGTTLTGANSVTFGGIAATFTVVSASEITTTVPAGALTGSVNVTVGANTLTSALTYRVTPTISSFSPPSGPVGTPVTITGTGLTQTSKVTFNNTVATFTVNSDTQVTATVPTGATTGKIALTTPGGTATSATSFTVN
jgi:uncharacterized repeat protein (TIGR03803 family)